MAIKIHDLYHKKDSWLVYDWRPDALRITRQFTKLEERGDKVNPRKYECRVYSLGNRYGLHGRCIKSGTYEECLKVFKEKCKTEYLELQLQIAPKGYGVDTYIDNKDDYYSYLYECDRKRREREDESRYWRPGDAPWEAPGMSIRDFM